jgi:hypothetical protein
VLRLGHRGEEDAQNVVVASFERRARLPAGDVGREQLVQRT